MPKLFCWPGGWAWTSGRPVSYTKWTPGEPHESEHSQEDCVEMFGEKGEWNVQSCDKKQGYICRVPMREFKLFMYFCTYVLFKQ